MSAPSKRCDVLLPEISTPAALVDLEKLERNLGWMAARAKDLDVRLRPHIKTHKSVHMGRLQTRGQHGGITVSTFAEASAFADAGFRDITWALPIPLSRVAEVASLSTRVDRLHVLVDHHDTVEALEAHGRCSGVTFDVLLKIDCGNHRAGVDPRSESAVELGRRLATSAHLRFRGVLAHGGHAYACTTRAEIERVAQQERDETVGFAERLRASGVEVETVSVGSTPTMAVARALPGVTEIRPGNYALFDVFQATLGVCTLDDVALSVLATVVGVYPDRNTWVIDAGGLALSLDPGAVHIDRDGGFGRVIVPGSPSMLRVRSLSQEHGVVEGLDRAGAVRVGDRVRVLPNHACMTAAMFSEFNVILNGRCIDRWPLARGWNS
jgi:D-serine deaminase-like pyridoxal phosphate-dependent protein